MTPLGTVLRNYAENLRTIQYTTRMVWYSPVRSAELQAALEQALIDAANQRDILLVGIADAEPGSSEYNKKVASLVADAWTETSAIVADPRHGEPSAVGAIALKGWWETLPPFARHVGEVIIGLIGVAAGVYIVNRWIVPQIEDPTGIKAKLNIRAAVRSACQKAVDDCPAGDTECLRDAKRFCKELKADEDGTGCGLLDTPYGTIIGGIVGFGLAWSGMRTIMRWGS